MEWAGVVAFVLVGGLTEFVRRFAIRLSLTDAPDQRKGHKRPTPYLGGVLIVIGVLAPSVIALRGGDARLWTLVLAAAAVAVLGLADDLRPLATTTQQDDKGQATSTEEHKNRHIEIFGSRIDAVFAVVGIVVITN